MIFATQLSDPNIAFATLVITLLLAIFAAIWRAGNKLGGISQTQLDHERRITELEVHEHEHDIWHLNRGDK